MEKKLLEYIDKSLDGIIKRTLMYGSLEARECQVIMLLEMRRLITHPDDKEFRMVYRNFSKFIYRKFYPDGTCQSLSTQVKDRGLNEEDTDKEFTKIIKEFIEETKCDND